MKKLILFVIVNAVGFAVVPPEIPDLPQVALWSPNTATFPQQQAVIYSTFDLVRDKLKGHGYYVPDPHYLDHNSFSEFLSLFGPIRYGYYLLLTHGGGPTEPNWLMLEAYLDEAAADQRVLELKTLYPGEEANIKKRLWTSQEPPFETYYCVCINSIFINNRWWSLPNAFMFVSTCYGATGSPSICDAFRNKGANATVGYTSSASVSESPLSAFCTFYHMAGWSVSPEKYELRNKHVSEAVAEYQDHYTNHPNRYSLLIEGNNQMKFYNSPRIVGLLVKQAGKTIYQYHFDAQSYYPYEWDYPGDLSGCPQNPAVIGNQPLEIQILFSSLMNPTQEPPHNIKVYIVAEQGNFAIPVSGNWAKCIFDNDWWFGACDFSEWSGGENAIVRVDAEDAFEGDINAKLDINGNGNSDAEDINHKFKIEPPPQVIFTDPADGEEDVDIYQVITIQFSKQMDRQSTEQALEIKNTDKGHLVGIKKIEWFDNDETLLIYAYDPEVDPDTI
ncbi:MAG TPA: hypothetical protein ENI34_04685, partial [candidate division WOR-3 bacterium]|nr:hypothetical protein [candidate division WOR-3 bacterium]